MQLSFSIFFLLAMFFTHAGEITKKPVPLVELKKAKLPFKVFVPRFIPQGFKFSNAEIISEKGQPEKWSPNYTIQYCNLKNDCYTFESASEFGDGPEGTKQQKGNSKLLGAFRVFFFPPKTEGNETRKTYVLTSWIPEKENTSRRYHLFGHGLSINDAIKIIESLE